MAFKNTSAVKGKKGFQSANNDEILGGGNSDAWNVAQGYVQIKILRLLIQLDRYDTIAQFGTEEMEMDMGMDISTLNKKRLEGLQRFMSTLKQLIGNVKFSIKKEDREGLSSYKDRIKNIEDVMPQLFDEEEDQVSHVKTLVIDEELFRKCIKILQEIKDELNTPINKAGLIFKPSDEVDLDKIMQDIVQGG